MSFGVSIVYLGPYVRSHFQMEINILQISVDILAVWQAGVEFSDVSASLSRSLRSKPCTDLRLAAADSFGSVVI